MSFTKTRSFFTVLLLLSISFCFACGNTAELSTGSGAKSPTEAYQKIYTAVKAKDYAAVKSLLTKGTIAFADARAKSTNQTLEQMVANGFSETTFSPAMPEIRDERIKDNMGAVEVWNSKSSKWEDLPFINEDGWKLAIGEVFSNKYKSPGDGRAKKEAEANPQANTVVVTPPMNVNGAPPANSNPAGNAVNSAKR